MAKVSVIMPTFNGRDYIRETIDSVLRQSFEDVEFLIVNDASTNSDTEKIILEYQNKDPRIVYLKNETNLKTSKSINRALKQAKGDYIARIDDDDLWLDKDKLKKQVEFLDKNPEYVLAGTGVVVINENGKKLFRYLHPEKDKDIRKKILTRNCFATASVLFRKDKALELGGYDEYFVYFAEDYNFWMQLGLIGKFYNIPEYSTAIRQHSKSVFARVRKITFWTDLKIIWKYKSKYPGFWKAFPLGILRWLSALIPIPRPIFNFIYRIYKNQF